MPFKVNTLEAIIFEISSASLYNFSASVLKSGRVSPTTRSQYFVSLADLRAISKKYKFEIIEMQVMEDHVHLFLSMKPTQNISYVVQCLKGISSRHLREMYPELRAYGDKLWSAGKFFRSVGSVTAETIEYYIKESQGKRKESTFVSKTGKRKQNPQTKLSRFIS